MARGDRLAGDPVVVQRPLDVGDHALGVDNVGGEECLHLAGDLVDSGVGARRPASGLELLGDLANGVAAQLER